MRDEHDIQHEPGQALRALPLLAPPRDAWPGLATALPGAGRVQQRSWRRPLALAAALVVALLGALLLPTATHDAPGEATPAQSLATVAAEDSEAERLLRLQDESMRLETLVAWSRAESVQSATTEALSASLLERIAHLDALLARADVDRSALVPLWQERVLRLRQLAELQDDDQRLAAHGDSGTELPVRLF